MKTEWINNLLIVKHDLLNEIAKDGGYLDQVLKAAEIMTKAIKNGNKILLAGNGGSAADAQHFAGEIVGRFLLERDSLPAISLCVDPSVMTCIGNDYGYDVVFSRQLEGVGQKGDVLIGLSTSGNSKNVVLAFEQAQKMGITTVGLVGRKGGVMKDMANYCIAVPADTSAHIQEMHITIGHLICDLIEKRFYGEK